jgi:transcriptional regulator with PAS, ATPase and Fis domain
MPHCKRFEVRSVVQTDNSNDEADEIRSLRSMEENHIKELLGRYRGNRKRVAEALGISERTIYRKLKRLGIN